MSLAASLPSDSSYRGQIPALRRTFHRCTVASVPIDHLTLDEATSHIIEVLRLRLSEKPLLIMGPNAQLVTLATRNERFAAALKAADLNIADGISVVLASRLLGGPIRTRVTGGDLMENLCKSAAGHHLRIFFSADYRVQPNWLRIDYNNVTLDLSSLIHIVLPLDSNTALRRTCMSDNASQLQLRIFCL
jgi:hypothetical protein